MSEDDRKMPEPRVVAEVLAVALGRQTTQSPGQDDYFLLRLHLRRGMDRDSHPVFAIERRKLAELGQEIRYRLEKD